MTDHRAFMHEVGLLKKELQEIRHTLVDKSPPLGYTLAAQGAQSKEVNSLLYRQAEIINRLVELSIYK